ncbi:hypothetical protein F4561_002694 [Lipingzhangella halophila]|uniref:Uncharacterized protein n=1 Tax=Lipingzhangella halophila TaxID=1783352 RepID=A0A7W7W3J5_9ACTN|nr:hypothetical protein [Lipingzhangella halophila]
MVRVSFLLTPAAPVTRPKADTIMTPLCLTPGRMARYA